MKINLWTWITQYDEDKRQERRSKDASAAYLIAAENKFSEDVR